MAENGRKTPKMAPSARLRGPGNKKNCKNCLEAKEFHFLGFLTIFGHFSFFLDFSMIFEKKISRGQKCPYLASGIHLNDSPIKI